MYTCVYFDIQIQACSKFQPQQQATEICFPDSLAITEVRFSYQLVVQIIKPSDIKFNVYQQSILAILGLFFPKMVIQMRDICTLQSEWYQHLLHLAKKGVMRGAGG